MSIFDLHAAVLNDYRDFVRSFFTVADGRAQAFVEQALVGESRFSPEFLLQASPSDARKGATVRPADASCLEARGRPSACSMNRHRSRQATQE